MRWQVIQGDCIEGLKALPDAGVHCCVTSPPYFGLRDYGHEDQIGLESTPTEYVERLVSVFREVRRVLRDDGTLWLNLGDSYCGSGGYAPDAPCNKARENGESWGAMNAFSTREGQARKKSRPGYTPPGLKPKDLLGIPWRVAFALQADGWYLRQDIIWHKPNPMPESVTDRCTKAHEYIFLLSKSQRYHYDAQAIAEPAKDPNGYKYEGGYRDMVAHAEAEGKAHKGNRQHIGNARTETGAVPHFSSGYGGNRNKRSVWTINPQPCHEAHFAVMPEELAELCICAGCPEDGVVLDPFTGSGTTGIVALRHQRHFIGTELNAEYCEMARRRIASSMPLYAVEAPVQ